MVIVLVVARAGSPVVASDGGERQWQATMSSTTIDGKQ